MKLVDGKFVLEKKPCVRCYGSATVLAPHPCSKCHGTGRTKAGKGKGECRKCHGFKTEHGPDTLPCPRCNGVDSDKFDDETLYDWINYDIWKLFKFRVYTSRQAMSFNDSYLGIGNVAGATDYGRHYNMTDSELIAEVRDGQKFYTQAVQIADKDGNACDYLAIIRKQDGYVVKPIFVRKTAKEQNNAS